MSKKRKAMSILAAIWAVGCVWCSFVVPVEAADGTVESAAKGNYVAIGVNEANIHEGDKSKFQDSFGQDHEYIATNVEGTLYWVRKGYGITVNQGKYFNGAESDVWIDAYKISGFGADSEGLVYTNKNSLVDSTDKTVTKATLHKIVYTGYMGVTNSGGTETPAHFSYMILRNGEWIDAGGSENLYKNFREVTFDDKHNVYKLGNETVPFENVYNIDETIGTFVTEEYGTTPYLGPVYGRNNEILVTAKVLDGKWHTVWAAQTTDPNATIGTMRVESFENILEAIHKEDVILSNADIMAAKVDGSKLNFVTKDGHSIEGMTVNTEVTDGNDTKLTIIGSAGGTLALVTGSRVEANKADGTTAVGDLTSLTINGKKFTIKNPESTVLVNGVNTNVTRENTTAETYKVNLNKDVDLTGEGSLKVGTVVVDNAGINAGGKVISNVVAGIKDTDAVNVGQLKEVISDNKAVVIAGNNVSVTSKGNEYTVGLKDNITLGNKGHDKQSPYVTIDGTTGIITNGKVTLGTTYKGEGGIIAVEGTIAGNQTCTLKIGNFNDGIYIDGLTNQEWNGTATSGRAATEGQLYKATWNKIGYDTSTGSKPALLNKITLMENTTITNVADAVIADNSKDAVNGSQLHSVLTEAQKKTEITASENVTVQGNSKDGYIISAKDTVVNGGSIDYKNGKLTINQSNGTSVEIAGLHNYYTTNVELNAETSELVFTRNDGQPGYSVKLDGFSTSDYRLVGAETKAGSKDYSAPYSVKDGKIVLNVQNTKNGAVEQVTLSDIASTTDISNIQNILQGGKLSFKGDSGKVKEIKLGETLNVKGDGNISVVSGSEGLKVNLNKNLKVDSINSTTVQGDNILIKEGDKYVDINNKFAAAKTEVKVAGTAVDAKLVGLETTTGADGQSIYTVNVKDMRVESAVVKYATDGAGSGTITNKDGSTVAITGLKDLFTSDVTLKDNTLTVSRNDGENFKIELSQLDTSANSSDFQLVGAKNEATGAYDAVYKVGKDGSLTLNIYDAKSKTLKAITLEDFSSKSKVDAQFVEVNNSITNIDNKISSGNFVKGDGNVISSLRPDGSGFDLKLAETINIGGEHKVIVNGVAGVVTGLTNKTWDSDNIVSGQAATEDQLQAAIKVAIDSSAAAIDSSAADDIHVDTSKHYGVVEGKVAVDVVNSSEQLVINDVASERVVNNQFAEVNNKIYGNTEKIANLNKRVTTNETNIADINGRLGSGVMNFIGDNKDRMAVVALDGTLNIAGGAVGELSDNNISVVGAADGLTIKLAKDVAGLNKIESTVVRGDSFHIKNGDKYEEIKYIDGKVTIGGDTIITDSTESFLAGDSNVVVEKTVSGYGLSLGASISIGGANKVTVDGIAGTVNGLTNKTWNHDNIVSGRAATEDQLKLAVDEAKQEAASYDQHVDYSKEYTVTNDNKLAVDIIDKSGVNGQLVLNDIASAKEVGRLADVDRAIRGSSLVASINSLSKDKVGNLDYNSNKYVANGDSLTTSVGKLDAAIKDASTEAAKHTTVSIDEEEKNLTLDVTIAADGHKDYKVGLSKDLDLTADGSLTLGKTFIKDGNIAVDDVRITGSAITGLANTEWDAEHYGEYGVSSKAATESQLFKATEGMVRYDRNEDGTFNYGQLTLAGSTYANRVGGTRIVNVAYASGENGSEVVNVDYLKDQLESTKGDLTTNEKHVQEGEYEIKDDNVTLDVVDGNGNKVGDVVIKDVASATALDRVEAEVDALDKKVGDLDDLHEDIKGDTIVDSMNKIDNKITNIENNLDEVSEEAGKHSSVSNGDGNLTIKEGTNDKGGVDYEVGLCDDVNINNSLTVGGEDGMKITEGNVTGLDNKTWNPDAIVSGQAVTEDQLKDATAGMVAYDKNADGSVNTSKVTLAENKDKDGNVVGTTIGNVADGKIEENSKDAVNGGQLFDTNQAVVNNFTNIQKLSQSISSVNGRVDKVGAGAAALAALHPLDFDPDDKLTFAAGVGNYGGSTATSLGAFYRPTEKTMVSVAGTYGNGENMVNMGVSFALDKENNVSNSRVAMAKEIVAMREHMAKQDQQIAQLVGLVNRLTGSDMAYDKNGSVLFPDVPENHWAYAYISDLAKRGIIEGYPDGNFAGDRTMTRYEFATMLYKAMVKGAVISDSIQNEFKFELARIRVDLLKGEAGSENSIERVRVNNGEGHNDYGDKGPNFAQSKKA